MKEELTQKTDPSTRIIHISFSLSLFLSFPPVIQSLPNQRPLTNLLILLSLGNMVCMAPQPYIPTTATSLFPPILNCQSSTSFGSKFSSDVTIKRWSGYIICKKLELGKVQYRGDWGVGWITCCYLALSMKLRWMYFLLFTFLLESSIF